MYRLVTKHTESHCVHRYVWLLGFVLHYFRTAQGLLMMSLVPPCSACVSLSASGLWTRRFLHCSDVSIHRFFLISIIPVAPKFTAASRGTPCDSVASCLFLSRFTFLTFFISIATSFTSMVEIGQQTGERTNIITIMSNVHHIRHLRAVSDETTTVC